MFFALQERVILPKLPVPDLQQTLKQYLLFVKPITNEQRFKTTKKIVEDFGNKGGLGEKLQNCLIERYKKKENWVRILVDVFY